MSAKRKNYQTDRRRIRRAEKQNHSNTAPIRDKSIGLACRRGWGAGKDLK